MMKIRSCSLFPEVSDPPDMVVPLPSRYTGAARCDGHRAGQIDRGGAQLVGYQMRSELMVPLPL